MDWISIREYRRFFLRMSKSQSFIALIFVISSKAISHDTSSISSAIQDKGNSQFVQEKGVNHITLDYSLTSIGESSGSEEECGRERILKLRRDPILSLDSYADPAYEQFNRHRRMLEKGLRNISRSPSLEIGSSTIFSSVADTVLGRRSRSETDDEETESSRRRQRVSKTTQERLEDTVKALCARYVKKTERGPKFSPQRMLNPRTKDSRPEIDRATAQEETQEPQKKETKKSSDQLTPKSIPY
ncbi:hypothetical protein BCR41DRAFT_425258 [Lobosporangium transversale]|uniref:Uncharacterized protein n=1 Tax=Lobosporangium transversale TaxID=64571 RepID=A0A1Y2GD27_9FUNG|nr:hypothetical protein BCR41DRAFT_425258 [Lobosporangium transversale]ORZ06141.1 hypothetical protein BCR41DRAFT_425258 [Lobosporangium transversale]|eukprot:XP_021877410.1 hypothetical protein BCR41DRAFT_425258 [Lobosporangium transversale]